LANNVMFIVHRPTGKAVRVAKRMGDGWYIANDDLLDHLTILFDLAEKHDDPQHSRNIDNFSLAMEYCEESGDAYTDWDYGGQPADENGLRTLFPKLPQKP